MYKFNLTNNPYNIKISSKQKILFLEQFSNLLNSGIPIINSLKIINYQTKNENIKNLIIGLLDKINKGIELKDAMQNYKYIFNSFDISIVNMGQTTGKLGSSIELIREKEEKVKELKGKIIGALVYPTVIIILAISMIMVFMIYVIPKIQNIYKDANVNLPTLTQIIINISTFLQKNITYIILGIMIFIMLFNFFRKHKNTKIYYDKFILTIPFFGGLIKKKILSLFSSSLGILLQSGVIINNSLEISAGALENDYYAKDIKRLISGVSKGENLSTLMGINEIQNGKEHPLFPIELASIIKIGEQTGKMPELLIKISSKFNKEIDNIVRNLSTAIEPLVIILVGIIIGTIIMAIMLPFFNMVNVM